MKVTVKPAGIGLPLTENHLAAEVGFKTETVEDVVNLRCERERTYPKSEEPYPQLTFIHSDGSVTKQRGRLVDVEGETTTVKTVTADNTTATARNYKNCVSVWWECTRNEFDNPQYNLHIIYQQPDGGFVWTSEYDPEYSVISYPNGETYKRGENPMKNISYNTEPATIEVEDDGEQFSIENVREVTANAFGVDRHYTVYRMDGKFRSVDKVTDVKNGRTVIETKEKGNYTETTTYCDCLSIMDDVCDRFPNEDEIYRVGKSNKIGTGQVAVTRWRPSGDVYMMEPDGAEAVF